MPVFDSLTRAIQPRVKLIFFHCSFFSSAMLKLGKSKPWPEALEKLTGTREMDVGPLKEYFDPLYKWMKKQREEKGYPLGWDEPPTSGVGTLAPALLAVIGAAFAGVARMFNLWAFSHGGNEMTKIFIGS